MNNNVAIFLKKSAILLVIIVAADVLLGNLLEHFYFKMKTGQSSRITHVLTKIDEDLVVFGSSRANHHYVPHILEDSLHVSAYNAGIDGQSMLFQYSALVSMKGKKMPKIIVLDLNQDWFDESATAYDRLYVMLPYYKVCKNIQPIVNLRSRFEPVKTISTLYRYNYFILPILANNTINRNDKEEAIQGYVPLFKTIKLPLVPKKVEKSTGLDTIKVNIFKSFIRDAKNANCKVFVCISPFFKRINDKPLTFSTAEKICSEENIPFNDYSNLPIFSGHPELFDDANHLNNTGAEMYSRIIASVIKKSL